MAEASSHLELDREAEEVTIAVMAASRLLVAISARALASTIGEPQRESAGVRTRPGRTPLVCVFSPG
ncbi:hypothetical protein [Streptomyces sp. NPDC002788]